MKTILVVDDEDLMRKLLVRGLSSVGNDFTILTAGNGEEAISLLSSQAVDMVITDLQMPVMDGFELISYLLRTFPSMPLFVLTGYHSYEVENRVKKIGGLRYFDKVKINFRTFAQDVQKALQPSTKGIIEGISLFSFLQLLQLERKSCSLTVHSSGRVGYLYFQNGEMTNAIYENIEGKFSAYEIVTWENVRIEIENTCNRLERVIDSSLDGILMDAFKLKDEREKDAHDET
ncbi:MAG: response regulator [Blastocatellia bacterium]|nr:response regulator [Blastocatellia bacterium]